MTPPPWEIDPETCVLLVIDMQNDFVLEGFPMQVPMARERLGTMRDVLTRCREAGVPVVYTQHIRYDSFDVSPLETAYRPWLREGGVREGTYGAEIVDELKPEPGEVVIRKHRYDAFHNTPLDTVLATLRGPGTVRTVIICGTVTEVCCESTARSAFMRDYQVAFLADATAALSVTAQAATLDSIGKYFGRVLSARELFAGPGR